jgi:hypothetical protein
MAGFALKVEIVVDDRVRPRGVSLLRGLEASAAAFGVRANVVSHPTYTDPVMVVWGAGAPIRQQWFQRQVKNGGHAICWDMGYWSQGRGNETFGMNRFSIDAMHPQAWVMRNVLPRARFDANAVPVSNTWNPDGHVVLAGLGPKTCDQYSLRTGEWERKKLAEIRTILPGRRIIFRPKPGNPFIPIGCESDHESPIEKVLEGAYLAVCRHSNVGIDAIRCGVPAAVDDGAAASVFSSDMVNREPVSHELRMRFLRNVAWFQWSIRECWTGAPWEFIRKLLG